MKTNPCCLLLVSALLVSCATDIPNQYYDASRASLSVPRQAFAGSECVNGFLPDTVYVKTATQTISSDYQFCVVDGRIYYKPVDPGSSAEWALLAGTGLPHGRGKFKEARRVASIAADADELFALSDEGYLYRMFLAKEPRQKPFKWYDGHGWPDVTPLALSDFMDGFRSWSLGVRNSHAMWHEDAAGNQHHWGTMGISTQYFLMANGQEIRYTDTGLPCDFSHSILGPLRGAFIAEALSASGSTIFLIGDAGEMYTRLVDFDTLGCDPMFFKYTYRPEKSELPGSDYWSNYSLWALPAEDWRRQPRIPLEGKAAITRRITILLTGQGNESRELRVAGLSAEGRPGYYHKAIFDDAWRFSEAPLELEPGDFLDAALVERGWGSRGPALETALSGSLWIDSERQDDLRFSVPDFSIREGSCTLEVSSGAERAILEFHPVDMWTYVKRYNPGLDGTPKLMFATILIPEGALEGASAAFSERVLALFGPLDNAVFACRVEATEHYAHIDLPSSKGRRNHLFLAREGFEGVDKAALRALSTAWTERASVYLSDDLKLKNGDSVSVARRSEVEGLLARNARFREELEAERRLFRTYGRSAELSRWGYSVVDFFTTITFLNRIDYPKIKTLTSKGDVIMQSNADAYRLMASSKDWTHTRLLELVDRRIEAYAAIIDDFDAGRLHSGLRAGYRETYADYAALAGLPELVRGKTAEGLDASLAAIPEMPLYPVLALATGLDRIMLIELDKLPSAAGRRSQDASRERPLILDARVVSIGDKRPSALRRLSGKDTVRLEWDGETMLVYRGAESEPYFRGVKIR